MSRRNQSAIEGAVILASKLPWWCCILMAIASYFLFNHLAITHQNQPPPHSMVNISPFIVNQFLIPSFWCGKLVFPSIFTIGAVVSLFRQTKRKRLYSSVVNSRNNFAGAPSSVMNLVPVEMNDNSDSQYDPLKNMSWQNFETLVSVFFKEQGYAVTDRGGAGADGGIDILLKKDGKKSIVQCKHWKTFKVGVNIVREQFGIMTAAQVDEAIIVTSGQFTQEAIEFAKNKNITLICGERLQEIIRKGEKIQLETLTRYGSPAPPKCPLCSSVMVERTALKGRWAGTKFWGCPDFPKCKGLVRK